MTQRMDEQVSKLRRALDEVRQKKDLLTPQTYSQMVIVLLEKIRHLQTIPKTDGSPRDEIRLVTVMFVDVVDSTILAHKLSSDWKNLIATAHERVTDVVQEWSGQVGQYLGDGVLSFFGAQQSRADDALRAVSSALAIQEMMQSFADEVQTRYKVSFAVRIGISTGKLTVGMIGTSEHQEFLALGPATNLAARLQSRADSGGILIDIETYHRVRRHFVTLPYEPTPIKGYEALIRYYGVLEPMPLQMTQLTEDSIGGETLPFVGYSDQLDQLLAQWEHNRQNQTFSVVSIFGDIGTGKSRMMQEFANRASVNPAFQIQLIARYEQRDTSHNVLRYFLTQQASLTLDMDEYTIRQQIENLIDDTSNHPDPRGVAETLSQLYLHQDSEEDTSASSKTRRFQERRVYVQVAEWFQAIAERSPLLILVDNLQWLDPLSVDLLEHLAEVMQNASGMLISAGRPDFQSHFPNYMTHHNPLTMSLHGLPNDAMQRLVDSILSKVDRLNPDLSELVINRSEGNPLFVHEFLAMLFDNGVIKVRDDGSWRFDAKQYYSTMSDLPNGLMGVLQARLDELPTPSRQVAQLASVVGQTFWHGVVAELYEQNVDAELDALIQRDIIIQQADSAFDGQTQYTFRHVLYRDVAYGMLPRAEREAYHDKVARWLVVRVSDKPEYYPTLSDHFANAKLYEAALFTNLEAVLNRLQRGLGSETLRLIERGLAYAQYMPREVALPIVSHLWALRGQSFNTLNRFEEATAACQTALRLLDEVPPEQLITIRILASRMLGEAFRSLGRYQEAHEALSTAYHLIANEDPIQMASILHAFGSLAYYMGRLGESMAYQQRAYTHAEESQLLGQKKGAMTQLGLIALDRGDISTALQYFEDVLRLNVEGENIHYQILDWINIARVYSAIFAYELSLEALERANALQAFLQTDNTVLKAYRGLNLIDLGDTEAGYPLIEDAVTRSHKDVHNAHLLQLIDIRACVIIKNYDLGLERANSFRERMRDINPILYGRATLWAGIASLEFDRERASELIEEAMTLEQDQGGRDLWLAFTAYAQANQNPELTHAYHEKSANILQAISFSLHSRPDLQAIFQNHTQVQGTMKSAGWVLG